MKQLTNCILILCIFFFLGCTPTSEDDSIDLVLKNGVIWTGNNAMPDANWVAIKNNIITSVGTNDDQPPQASKVIDLKGEFMVPGFNDSHVHFSSAGHLLLGINLLDVNDTVLFIDRVRETTKRLPAGSWITQGDWGAYEAWEMGSEGGDTKVRSFMPHKTMIDSITSEYPVLVTRYDRKVGLANQIALESLDIQSETGVLKGKDLEEALGKIPEKSIDRKIAESKRALEECKKWGLTTVQDMSPLDQLEVYKQIQQEGALTCRINFAPSKLSDYKMMAEKGWIIDKEAENGPRPVGDDWITFGTLKTHIDGIMGARSARFYEPYTDNSMEMKDWRGGWREFSRDMDNFKQMIINADNEGIQLRIHAIGDEANAILLNILDTLDLVNGEKDRRFRLVHAQVIADRDFARFKSKNIVAEVQPYHVTDDMRWMEERIGYERCKGAYAFQTLKKNGCILSFGSDWPGTNASYYPINPIYGLYAAVTRQTITGTPEEGWFPEQRLTLAEALKAYTHGSAYGAFEEKIKGTIEKGKLADLTVINTNLFETPPESWLNARISYTIVDGKVVYEAM